MKSFNIYAVKDELTNTFMQPVFVEKEDEILRTFKFQINNIPLWKDNAEDYSLFYLGTFDQDSGTLIGEFPKKIIGGRSVIGKENTSDL